MPVINREVVLTHDTIGVLAESLQLRLPAHMLTEPVAYEYGEWEQVLDTAHRELAHVGLLEEGEPAIPLLDTLQLLCRGSNEFYGVVNTQRHNYYVHVASEQQQAVFAVLVNEKVLLRPAKADMLATELLNELPETSPAAGRSMSAPYAELAPSQDGNSIYNTARPSGDARRLKTLLQQPRLAQGDLGTAIRVGIDNRRIVSTQPVSVFDLDDGRWLSYGTDRSGSWHYAATPGRHDTIANKLQELHRGLIDANR